MSVEIRQKHALHVNVVLSGIVALSCAATAAWAEPVIEAEHTGVEDEQITEDPTGLTPEEQEAIASWETEADQYDAEHNTALTKPQRLKALQGKKTYSSPWGRSGIEKTILEQSDDNTIISITSHQNHTTPRDKAMQKAERSVDNIARQLCGELYTRVDRFAPFLPIKTNKT